VKRVLFVCTHNSARSQMAEGLLRHYAGQHFEAFSAGTEPGSLHPLAVRAMGELGIDISNQAPKSVDGFLSQDFDAVVTVCDQAKESCPVFPGAARQLHWSFEDPSRDQGSEDERLEVFRRVRDEIMVHIRQFVSEQASEKSAARRTGDHR
jgi:arsenate reductase (thioredoxin)